MISTVGSVTGSTIAHHDGESIHASAGIRPCVTICTAAPTLARPYPKCSSQPGCDGSGTPVPTVFSGRTSSADSVRLCLTSFELSGGARPTASAADSTSPAAPAAWPVAKLPVSPSMQMCAWAPYWVRLDWRNHVWTGNCVPKPAMRNAFAVLESGSFCPRPCVSATQPLTNTVDESGVAEAISARGNIAALIFILHVGREARVFDSDGVCKGEGPPSPSAFAEATDATRKLRRGETSGVIRSFRKWDGEIPTTGRILDHQFRLARVTHCKPSDKR